MRSIFDMLRDPQLEGVDVDSTQRFSLHGKALQRKRMLREVFVEFHHLFRNLDQRFFSGGGLEIELGAGVAPMRETYPSVLATDVVYDQSLDRQIDSEAMDLADRSVRVFYGQNCFHHFPHPDRFFSEVERVLIPGGGVILLEPYFGPLAAFLFKRLFHTEGYDKTYPSWDSPATGPMNGANQALSYIVFVRDRKEFERKYPSLEIVHQQCASNYLKYLLSGGLNFRQLCPDFMIPVIDFLQWCVRPFDRFLALHHLVVIRRKL